jgi:acetylornithine deacetylase/succinyl-diaminopimelate desuccinylase-like protein
MANTNTLLEGEVTELLQALIRNRCVNDGSAASGHERRSVDTLTSYLGDVPLDLEVYEPSPGRASLVGRIEGRNPEAPTLLLMGHTDVVPVNEERWTHDPFGGELIDGEVWGRGAVDMLNLTASMAVATRHLAAEGWSPEGTLVFLAVADEEALGNHGARHLVANEHDAVVADHVITEAGGFPIPTPAGLRLPVIVGEKGTYWCRLTVRGTAGHGSQPYRSDNAVVTAAEVVRRIHEFRPETQIHDVFRQFIEGLGLPVELSGPLLSPESLDGMLESLPLGMARQFHACTHTTMSPNVIHGGNKVNTIPDEVVLEIDIRTLPGQRSEDAHALLVEALGDLAARVEIENLEADESTASAVDTPLWHSLERVSQGFYEGSALVPYLTVGATDARFFRGVGSTAYGFGMFSRRLSFEDYGVMFHGDDERVDVESLSLSTALWDAVARDLLG